MTFEQVTVFLIQYTMYIIIMQLSQTSVVSQLLFLSNVRILSAKMFRSFTFCCPTEWLFTDKSPTDAGAI